MAVGNVPGEERHADCGKRFGETNQSEGKRIVGQLIDLPPDDGPLDLETKSKGEERNDVATKVGNAQSSIGIGRIGRRCGVGHPINLAGAHNLADGATSTVIPR